MLGKMNSAYTFSLGFFALFLMNTSQFLLFDSIRGGIATILGFLVLNSMKKINFNNK